MYLNILMSQAKHKIVGRKKNACVWRITGEYKITNAGSNGRVKLATQMPQAVLPLVIFEDNKHIFV